MMVAATRARAGVRSFCKGGRRQGCRLCPNQGAAADRRKMVVKQTVINHSGKVINIEDDMDCTTESVLYLLSCGKQYLRETGNAVYQRYVPHEDSARDPATTKEVGLHFQQPGLSTNGIEMIPVEKVRGSRADRKIREKRLIREHQLELWD